LSSALFTALIFQFLPGLSGSQVFSPAWAELEPCEPALETRQNPPPPIAPWNFSNGVPVLSLNQILPERYVQGLHDSGFELEVEITKLEDSQIGPFPTVKIVAKLVGSEQEVLTLLLARDPRHPTVALLDGLNLRAPETPDQRHVRSNQVSKGVPFEVFAFAKRQLYALANAGGFTEISSDSQMTFAVTMLYLKAAGMIPRDEQSRKTIELLQRLFKYARTRLPEKLRPAGMDDFQKMITPLGGDHATQAAWTFYQSQRRVPADAELLFDGNEIVGIVARGPSGRREVRFVDLLNPGRPLLRWWGLQAVERTALMAPVPK
jgi:hypothetical protein